MSVSQPDRSDHQTHRGRLRTMVEIHLDHDRTMPADSPPALLTAFLDFMDHCHRHDVGRSEVALVGLAEIDSPFTPAIHAIAAGLRAEMLGRYGAAEAWFTTAIERDDHIDGLTLPTARVLRGTQRIRRGRLAEGLEDLAVPDDHQHPLTLQAFSVAVIALTACGDLDRARAGTHRLNGLLVRGNAVGLGWYALALEGIDDVAGEDCLVRQFWDCRLPELSASYLQTLGPHLIRHAKALNDGAVLELIDELTGSAVDGTGAGDALSWARAIAHDDLGGLRAVAERHRRDGTELLEMEALDDCLVLTTDEAERARLRQRRARIDKRLRRGLTPSAEVGALPPRIGRVLTEAERSVVAAVARGRSNREAAEDLHCSIRTIESHLTSVYRKLGIKRRTQLLAGLNQAGREGAGRWAAAVAQDTA